MVLKFGVYLELIVRQARKTVHFYLKRYKNTIADKSQIRYLKYILGVNKHSSNLAFLSETARFPISQLSCQL